MDGVAHPSGIEVLEIREHHLGDAFLFTDIWRPFPPVSSELISTGHYRPSDARQALWQGPQAQPRNSGSGGNNAGLSKH
jgi:hypothetical protein